jgi:hypothetical protein
LDVREILEPFWLVEDETFSLAILMEKVTSFGYYMEILKKRHMEDSSSRSFLLLITWGNTYPIDCWLKADTDDAAGRIERFLLLLDTKGEILKIPFAAGRRKTSITSRFS